MSEFFSMGGYALYVWGSYGVALICILLDIFSVKK
jgi:heme exporter protein D